MSQVQPRLDTESLGKIELKDHTGAPVRVDSAWQDTAALLVFLRHFG